MSKILIAEIRKLIANAQPEQATSALQKLVNSNPDFDDFQSVAIQLQADLTLLRRNKLEGLITDDDESVGITKLNKRILEVCQQLEADPKKQPFMQRAQPRNIVLGSIVAIVAIALGAWYFSGSNKETCVKFAGNEKGMFKVIVYPFINQNNSTLKPEAEIRDEINKLCESSKINAQAVWNDSKQVQGMPDAVLSARACDADMVIWGSAERSGDSTLLEVRYKLCKEEKWNIQNLKIQGESGLRAVRTISSIDASGELLSDVATTIKLIFGMVAMYKNDSQLAIQMLESIDPAVFDSSMHILLADNYISLGRQDEALTQLDKYVEKGGNSASAFNNRAMLNCNIGNYALAVSDLNQAALLSPADTLVLKNRAYALDKNEQYVEAERAIQVLQQAAPTNQWVAKKMPDVAKKAKAARATDAKIVARKPSKALSGKELIKKAEAEFQTGKTTQALATSELAVKAGGGKAAELLRLKIISTISPQKVAAAEKEVIAKGVTEADIRAPQLRIAKRSPIIPDTSGFETKVIQDIQKQ